MGGGKGGNFGNTKGSTLDTISNILAAASFIPGADTFTNLVSIPVDLLRGDFVSAGLDAIGVIPIVGEIADAAKTVDKVADVSKVTKKATNFFDFPKSVHSGRQGKHIIGHNNYKKGKSIFNGSADEAQSLIKKYSGTGRQQGPNKEIVDFNRNIGKYVDPTTGKAYDTTMGTIHYSKDGAHIVPARPKNN